MDFENEAAPDQGSKDPEAEFASNTRSMHMDVMNYLITTHLAWEKQPNHARISTKSACFLQATRSSLEEASRVSLDAAADVVTLIFDVVTDKSHFHLVKEEHGEKEIQRVASLMQEGQVETDDSYFVIHPAKAAEAGAAVIARKAKDAVPLDVITRCVAAIANRCVAAGQEMHLILTGCNTISACLPLKKQLPVTVHEHVWVLCTTDTWSSDLAPFLWHLYGSYAMKGDLTAFRTATRELLGEYTEHFKRQRVADASRPAARRSMTSLAEDVCLERLDRIQESASGHASMPLL